MDMIDNATLPTHLRSRVSALRDRIRRSKTEDEDVVRHREGKTFLETQPAPAPFSGS